MTHGRLLFLITALLASRSSSTGSSNEYKYLHRRLSNSNASETIQSTTTSSSAKFAGFLHNYPAASSTHNRFLGFVNAFDLSHMEPVILSVEQYLSMCEGGWNVTMIIHTTHDWSDKLRRYLRYKTYCYRINAHFPVRIQTFARPIGTSLGAMHRKYLTEELDSYDIFAFHEDDMLLKHAHLSAYLSETLMLHNLTTAGSMSMDKESHPLTQTAIAPDSDQSFLKDYLIGFMRYTKKKRSSADFKENGVPHHSEEEDIMSLEEFDEHPRFKYICLSGAPYLHIDKNTHQAMWMLTREQVLYLQQRCQFLNQTGGSREYMSSLSIYDASGINHPGGTQWSCNMRKLIPGEQISAFFIQHYYPGRGHQSKPYMPVIESLLSGKYDEGRVPDCWKNITEKYKAEISAQPSNHTIIDIYAGYDATAYNGKAVAIPARKPTIYLMQNGILHAFPDFETFTAMKFKPEDVVLLSEYEISITPKGSILPTIPG